MDADGELWRTLLERATSRMRKMTGKSSCARSVHFLHHLKSRQLIPFSQDDTVISLAPSSLTGQHTNTDSVVWD